MAPFGTENRGRAGGRWLDDVEWQWIAEVENGTFGRLAPCWKSENRNSKSESACAEPPAGQDKSEGRNWERIQTAKGKRLAGRKIGG
jgi:hypothetical protein